MQNLVSLCSSTHKHTFGRDTWRWENYEKKRERERRRHSRRCTVRLAQSTSGMNLSPSMSTLELFLFLSFYVLNFSILSPLTIIEPASSMLSLFLALSSPLILFETVLRSCLYMSNSIDHRDVINLLRLTSMESESFHQKARHIS